MGGETSRSRGETGDIIFTEWNLRSKVYPKCR